MTKKEKRSYIHRALEKFEAIQYIDAENGNDAKTVLWKIMTLQLLSWT